MTDISPSSDNAAILASLLAEGKGLLTITVHHPDGTRQADVSAALNMEDIHPDNFYNCMFSPCGEVILHRLRKWAEQDAAGEGDNTDG
ncbi:hypothetical protein [Nocardia asiatica]|uniref:hypothetical protein n=1 Tax=Nocardia asiatica TaxID=209252 RepID=UPI00245544CF|nr:hypothetical protein [Nocardia asiatica]